MEQLQVLTQALQFGPLPLVVMQDIEELLKSAGFRNNSH
jgi:hypothetical protein